MLMAGVGRQIQRGGRRTVEVSVLNEKGDKQASKLLIQKHLMGKS